MERRIKERANEYITLESNERFRGEVEQLLAAGTNEADEELNDRFYRDLDFGTGGMRGVIGGGRNRMNTYTVGRASEGLARYMKMSGEQDLHLVVAYDSRNCSELFARQTAVVMAANAIKCSLFTALRPTPELSFAVRYLKATAGVVITASHNPAEYNGYKVYWADGGQITPPHDKGIITEVRDVTGVIPSIDEAEARSKGLIVAIDKEVDTPYIAMAKKQALRPALMRERGSDIKVVFTPLHGTGRTLVEPVLKEFGIELFLVPEQAEPDGSFPTVPFPNPEIASAMSLALKHAKEQRADLVFGTDPDADRLGIAVPDDGEYRLITGNQLGALLLDYILTSRRERGTMPPNAAFINTIVTSQLQNRIADSFDVKSFRVLTGFKYIGEMIRRFEKSGEYSYVFGCEESYGYLVGPDVRDKDAVTAAALAVEMALWNVVEKRRSVLDHLRDIYDRFGYYEETLIDHYFKGESGAAAIQNLMRSLREKPRDEWGRLKITEVRDIESGETLNLTTGKRTKDIDLPASNVLQFVSEEGTLITARPSGTEPKIKFYASCRIPFTETEGLDRAKAEGGRVIKEISGVIEEMIAEVAQ